MPQRRSFVHSLWSQWSPPDRYSVSKHVRFFVYCLLLLAVQPLCAQAVKAQAAPSKPGAFDATTMHEPTDLAATWLVKGGDNLDYARPDFDDSGWAPFDPSTSIKRLFPQGNPGIVWYRLHVKVAPDETGLALEESNISRAFSVYANGVKLIETAHDTGAPIFASIPENQIAGGSVVIALRVKLDAADWGNREPGFYSPNLRLGLRTALHDRLWLTVIGAFSLPLLQDSLILCLSFAGILLYSAQPRQREYLWLFLTGICLVPPDLLGTYGALHSLQRGWHALDGLVGCGEVCWALMFFAFVRQRINLALRIVLLIIGVSTAATGLTYWFGTFTPSQRLMFSVPLYLLFIVVLPTLLLIHWRRGNREAGILLIPLLINSVIDADVLAAILLRQIPHFNRLGDRLLAPLYFNLGPFGISLFIAANMLSALALSLIILLRTNRLSREGAELEGEMAAARQVQQVMLPEQIEAIPGFSIESVYLPAKQVGGDFFQILAAGDGGMLVVVGGDACVGAGRGHPKYRSLWPRSRRNAGPAQREDGWSCQRGIFDGAGCLHRA